MLALAIEKPEQTSMGLTTLCSLHLKDHLLNLPLEETAERPLIEALSLWVPYMVALTEEFDQMEEPLLLDVTEYWQR